MAFSVNGLPIMVSELQEAYQAYAQQYQMYGIDLTDAENQQALANMVISLLFQDKLIQQKAAELGLGSVILFGFIRHLGEEAEYIKMLDLPEGTLPLLAVAVGHAPGSDVKRKEDRHFQVISRD